MLTRSWELLEFSIIVENIDITSMLLDGVQCYFLTIHLNEGTFWCYFSKTAKYLFSL